MGPVLIQAGVTWFIPAVLILLGLPGPAGAGPPKDPFPDPADKPKLAETPPNPGELAMQRVAAAMRSRPDYPATESAVEFALYLYAVSRDEADLEMAGRLAEKLEDSPGTARVRSQVARAGGKGHDRRGSLRFDMESQSGVETLEARVASAMVSGSPEAIQEMTSLAGEMGARFENSKSKDSVLENCRVARSLWEVGFITGNDELKKKAEGKTPKHAFRCLKRRLVDIVFAVWTSRQEYQSPEEMGKAA